MICEVYSVFDGAVKAFLPPFQTRSKGEAIRSFSEAVNSRDHQFNKHASDYVLFALGSFDDGTGLYTTVEPVRVVAAREVLEDDVFPPGKRVS